ICKHQGSATPSRKEVREGLAKQLGSKELLIIRRMHSIYGRNETTVEARLYPEKKQAEIIETHHILVRNGLAERKAQTEAPKKQQAK
ncbi:MAG: hypothetical protein QXP70_02320, partial [Methanomassiliicoccales archaeon]